MLDYKSIIEKNLEIIDNLLHKKQKNLLKKLFSDELRVKDEFFSFEHIRIIYKLNDILWICLLVSIYNRIYSELYDPIDKSLEIYFDKSRSFDLYEQKKNLEDSAFFLFLNKDKKIDEYIFSFLMSNGMSSNLPREIDVYFPNDNIIEREKECLLISELCLKNNGRKYIFVKSPKGTGKRTLVKCVSSKSQKVVVITDIEKCLNSENDFSQTIFSSLRQVLLLNGNICFNNFDLLYEKKRQSEFIFKVSKRFCKNSFFLLNKLLNFEIDNIDENVDIIDYTLKELNKNQIKNIWKNKTENLHISKSISYAELANMFNFTPGQIDYASKLLRSSKMMGRRLDKQKILKEIRKTAQAKFKNYAHIVISENGWNDLIIPDDDKKQIMDICAQYKLRNTVFEDWGLKNRVGYGLGLSLLFSGAPGTGKTMVAGIISNDIGLDLYRVDLSRIVSKYIGETEKNLSELFSEAERSSSILLFDETDALFSQRTIIKDSHDRGANLEISYLLQKMEEHKGICIMTTNYIENIDNAFFRRISYVFHFPKPGKNDRKKIWKNIFGKKVPLSSDIDFDFLSRFEISGGNIKSIVISSCLKAAQEHTKVSMKHIVRSIEYEIKKQGYTPLKSEFAEYAYLL